MSLTKQIQLRKGTVSLSVFKGEEDGKVMVSLDKDFVSRRVKGPLFSEAEIYDLVEIIRDYDEWESRVVNGRANERLMAKTTIPQRVSSVGYDAAVAQREIEEAIRRVSCERLGGHQAAQAAIPSNGQARITVLPTLPKFRYLHTCPKCGCHVQSTLRLAGATLRVCPACDRVDGIVS